MCVIVGVFVFGLWSALLLKAQKPVPDSHEWKVYTNAKFSYAICYPNDLLIPQGEPDAGDGQTFLAKDGAKLTVFSDYGSGDIALKDRLEWTTSELAGAAGKVTYKVIRPQMFVVSGRTGQTVFYAKADTTLGKFKEFELTYDLAQSAVYDPIVKRLAGGCFVNIGGK
jgi:hypothetical protein